MNINQNYNHMSNTPPTMATHNHSQQQQQTQGHQVYRQLALERERLQQLYRQQIENKSSQQQQQRQSQILTDEEHDIIEYPDGTKKTRMKKHQSESINENTKEQNEETIKTIEIQQLMEKTRGELREHAQAVINSRNHAFLQCQSLQTLGCDKLRQDVENFLHQVPFWKQQIAKPFSVVMGFHHIKEAFRSNSCRSSDLMGLQYYDLDKYFKQNQNVPQSCLRKIIVDRMENPRISINRMRLFLYKLLYDAACREKPPKDLPRLITVWKIIKYYEPLEEERKLKSANGVLILDPFITNETDQVLLSTPESKRVVYVASCRMQFDSEDLDLGDIPRLPIQMTCEVPLKLMYAIPEYSRQMMSMMEDQFRQEYEERELEMEENFELLNEDINNKQQ